MSQKNLKIPSHYFELEEKYKDFFGEIKTDQYGYRLEVDLNVFYKTECEIYKASAELYTLFSVEDIDKYDNYKFKNEYDLGYITDFSNILSFGMDSFGCDFCMDFSKNLNNPRVIYWDGFDSRWRVIANDLEGFFPYSSPHH